MEGVGVRALQSLINNNSFSVILCVFCASVVKPSLRSIMNLLESFIFLHHRGTERTELHRGNCSGCLVRDPDTDLKRQVFRRVR